MLMAYLENQLIKVANCINQKHSRAVKQTNYLKKYVFNLIFTVGGVTWQNDSKKKLLNWKLPGKVMLEDLLVTETYYKVKTI